jgi:uncharacterized SAM-binding protein YcdF (DUF218 family)
MRRRSRYHGWGCGRFESSDRFTPSNSWPAENRGSPSKPGSSIACAEGRITDAPPRRQFRVGPHEGPSAVLGAGGRCKTAIGSSDGGARDPQRGGIIFKFLALCVMVAFVFVLYLVRNPSLRLMGGALVLDDSPRAADAIVILGDDNYNGDRAARAAELMKAGWAPRVVASGRYLRPYASIADLEQHDLTDRGVPASAIVRFPQRADNTREECAAVSGLLASRGWRHVLLVTSNYHARRADYICSRLLPRGTELRVVAAADSEFRPDSWWQTRKGLRIFFHEAVGFVVAAWEMRHNSVRTED